jgi:hypothetical protein
MASNLLEHARTNAAFSSIKAALHEIGVDVSSVDDLEDAAKAIRSECVTGPNAVVNATISGGTGIRVVPVDRKGYKISSTADGLLTADIDNNLKRGSSVQKALTYIIRDKIPAAISEAIATPAIVSIETFKAESDGVDFYENRAYGAKGKGRKSGLHPYEWYLKIYTISSVEPLYVGLGNMLEDVKHDIFCDLAHMVDRQIQEAIKQHINKSHGGFVKRPRPVRPAPLHPTLDESYGGNADDDVFTVDTELPDDTFAGFDPDTDFSVDGSNNCDVCNPDRGDTDVNTDGENCDICSKDTSYGGNDSDSDTDFSVDHDPLDESFGGNDGDDSYGIDGEDEDEGNLSEDLGLDSDSDAEFDLDDDENKKDEEGDGETLDDFIENLNA